MTEEKERKVGLTGTSLTISLPDKWVKEKGVVKGDKVLVISDGYLKIIPSSFKITIDNNIITYIWKDKQEKMLVDEAKRLVETFGIDKAVEIIKKGLREKSFADFPEELIKEKVGALFNFLSK